MTTDSFELPSVPNPGAQAAASRIGAWLRDTGVVSASPVDRIALGRPGSRTEIETTNAEPAGMRTLRLSPAHASALTDPDSPLAAQAAAAVVSAYVADGRPAASDPFGAGVLERGLIELHSADLTRRMAAEVGLSNAGLEPSREAYAAARLIERCAGPPTLRAWIANGPGQVPVVDRVAGHMVARSGVTELVNDASVRSVEARVARVLSDGLDAVPLSRNPRSLDRMVRNADADAGTVIAESRAAGNRMRTMHRLLYEGYDQFADDLASASRQSDPRARDLAGLDAAAGLGRVALGFGGSHRTLIDQVHEAEQRETRNRSRHAHRMAWRSRLAGAAPDRTEAFHSRAAADPQVAQRAHAAERRRSTALEAEAATVLSVIRDGRNQPLELTRLADRFRSSAEWGRRQGVSIVLDDDTCRGLEGPPPGWRAEPGRPTDQDRVAQPGPRAFHRRPGSVAARRPSDRSAGL